MLQVKVHQNQNICLFAPLLYSFLPHVTLFPPSYFLLSLVPPVHHFLRWLFGPLLSHIFLLLILLLLQYPLLSVGLSGLAYLFYLPESTRKKGGEKRQVFPLIPSKPSLPQRYQFPYSYTHFPPSLWQSSWCVYHWVTVVCVYMREHRGLARVCVYVCVWVCVM